MSMIKNFFSRETKPSEPAPFIDLLTYRTSIQPISTKMPEEKLLNEIPVLDRGFLQKCKGDTYLLSKIKLPFNRNSLKEINEIASLTMPSEISCCVILYNCLCWYYSADDRQIDDFVMAIKTLNLIFKCSPTLSAIRNLVFIQFVKLSTSPPPRFKISEEIYHYLVIHLKQNTTIDSSIFSLLIQLFRQIMNSGKEEHIDEMYDVLINLLNVNQSFFDYDNISSFMPILNLTTLKMRSLNILAKLSTKSDASVIQDAYKQLPLTFKNIISKYKPSVEYVTDKTDLTAILPIIEFSESDNGEFTGEFRPVIYSALDDKYELLQLITEDLQKKLIEMSGSLSNSSKNSQKIFANRAFNLLSKLPVSNNFYQISASFFHIFQKIIDSELLKAMIQPICNSPIFSPQFTIFDKLPKALNTLRSFVFSLIEDVHPPHVVTLLSSLSKSPLVLTECLFRILSNISKYSLGLFASKEMIKIITEAGLNLKSVQSSQKVVTSSRTAYFLFMNQIINSTTTSYTLLKSKAFCQNYLCYFLEADISNYIKDTIENSISQVPANSYLKNCSSCFRQMIDDNSTDANLIELLSKCVSNSVRYNPSISFNFDNLLVLFLKFVEQTGNEKVFDDAMTLLMMSSMNPTFELSIKLYKQFSMLINKLYKTEPTRRIEWQLFSSLSSSITDFQLFIIKKPSIIPLILTAFSSSKRFLDIISKFTKLCNYSELNKKACHDGDLVYILSQLWISNKVHYANYEFEFQDVNENIRELHIYPLIQLITYSYSSNVVDDFYITNLENPSIFNLVMKMIPQCDNIFVPQFPIGMMPVQFTVKGFYPEDLKDGFTIHLCLNIDLNSVDDPNTEIEIFRISDSNEGFLSIFVSDSMIMTKYEYNGSRTTVVLVKMPAVNKYEDFTFVYKYLENRVRISSYQNLSSLNDSDFCYFEFASGDLMLSLGGYDGNYKTIHQYGIVKNFAIFPSTNLSNADLVKRLYKVEDQALFSSNCIMNPSKSNEFTVKRFNNKNVKNCPANMIITVNDSVSNSSSLLKTILTSNYSNQIAEKFFYNGILGTLKLLFQNSEHVQLEFESSKFIHLYLMKHPNLIQSKVYFELYDIFVEITDKILQRDWFEHLIINTWLWTQAKNKDLVEILTHWSKILVYSYKSLFQTKSYFSQLITQFRFFFCYEDECVKSFNIGHIEDDPEKLGVLRDLFLDFLSKVSYIHMNPGDVKEYFGHLLSNPSKATTIYLLQLFYCFSNKNVDTTDYFSKLLSLICDDNEINEYILLAIHYMFNGQLNSFQPLITAFEKLKFLSRSKTDENLLTVELFDKLCTKLHLFPNLLSILCLFALELHKEEELGALLAEEKEAISPVVVNNEFWYIWPVLLGFNTSSDCDSICNFIVYALTVSETVLQDIPYTIIFVNLLMFVTKETNFVEILINKFLTVKNTNPDIIKAAVEVCFYSCFFHFSGKSFHDFLLSEFEQQGIEVKLNEKDHVGFMENVRDLDDLRKMTSMSYTSIFLHFEFRIDLLKKWKDQVFAGTAMRLLNTPTHENERFILLFQYFTDPRLIQPDAKLYSLQMEMDTFIQEEFNNYKSLTKSCFSSLIQRFFPNFFKFIQNSIATSKQIASLPKLENEELAISKMKDEIERSSNLNVTIIKSNAIKLDNTCCRLFTPMKRRRKKVIKSYFHISEVSLDEPYFELNCRRITYSSDRNTVFRCSPKYVVVGEKVFPSNQLSLVLSRKRSNRENSIELFMRNGETFLLDFSPNDNSNVFKLLSKTGYKSTDVQKGSNCNFFTTSCHFTSSWEKGQMPNFDYLLVLNVFAGRSYNDLTLCPIFPLLTDNEDLTKMNNITTRKAKVVVTSHYLMRSEKEQIGVQNLVVDEADQKHFEFVYQLRKRLESEYVTNQLPKFIDNFFGFQVLSTWSSFGLFKKSHGRKTVFISPHLHSKNKEQKLKQKVLFAKFVQNDNPIYYASIVTSNANGNLEYKYIKIEAIPTFNVEIQTAIEIDSDESSAAFAANSDTKKVFVVNKSKCLMSTFIEKAKIDTTFFPFDGKFIKSCENELIYSIDGISVSLNSFINKHRLTLWKSNSRITHMDANSDFKVFALATIDNKVSVLSMNYGCQVNQVQFDTDIERMIFTKRWAFLTVFAVGKIVVLNVDGEVVKVSDNFNEKVVFAGSFRSINGFDFVVYQNDRNEIHFFEAFYPDKRKVIIQANSLVKDFLYDRMASCVVFIFENGLVQLVPFSVIE